MDDHPITDQSPTYGADMTLPTNLQTSQEAQRFARLLDRFAQDTAEVTEAIAIASDGLLIAMSSNLARADGDRFGAITSAIVSLAKGASRVYNLGGTNKVIIDLDRGYLLVSALNPTAALGVLATKAANLGNLAYDMATFANQVGAWLTADLVDELKQTMRT
jgi:predicted regulator of Ras-like GTPase activity (Roadblock/LC7/MglB family)